MVSTSTKAAVIVGSAGIITTVIVAGLSAAKPATVAGASCSSSAGCPDGTICLDGKCTEAVLSLSVQNASEEPGQSDVFTVHLTDANGNPIANYTVVLTQVMPDGSSGPSDTAVTDTKGDATFTVDFPADAEEGTYQFKASA